MLAAVISFAAAALAFAGVAVALAITGSKHKVESGDRGSRLRDATQRVAQLEEAIHAKDEFRRRDTQTIERQENEIESLRKLLREHAPSGVARLQFDRMLQEAGGEDGDVDTDGGG